MFILFLRSSLVSEYTYDHQSRRIARRTRDGVDDRYFYQGWNLIAVYQTGKADPVETFTWGKDLSGSLQGAGGVGGLLFAKKHDIDQDAPWIYHYDANGNVTEVTDSRGWVLDRYDYDAFGNLLGVPQLPGNRWRFSAKLRNRESGWYYYGYRYYDSTDGRWLSRDPIEEEGGLNLYGFVGNDPVNRWDYLGMKDFIIGFYGAGNHNNFGNQWIRKAYNDAGGRGYLFNDGRDEKALKKLSSELDSNRNKTIDLDEIRGHTFKVMAWSWGAPTATAFTRDFRSGRRHGYQLCISPIIDVLVTIDPVSHLKIMRRPLPNVQRWVNYSRE